MRLLRSFAETNSEVYSRFRSATEQQLQYFIDNYEQINFEESDAMLCLIGGGDYLGLACGAVGRTRNDDKLQVLGVAKEWFKKDRQAKQTGQDEEEEEEDKEKDNEDNSPFEMIPLTHDLKDKE